eukprot:3241671-Rhodomonas_salina.1
MCLPSVVATGQIRTEVHVSLGKVDWEEGRERGECEEGREGEREGERERGSQREREYMRERTWRE